MQNPPDKIQNEKPKTTKIGTCLPTTIWNQLTTILRPPYSRADEGKLDRGVLAEWIFDQALSTIHNKGIHDCMEQFISAKGLKEEFEAYFAASNKNLLQ